MLRKSRVRAARKQLRLSQGAEARNREALMQVILICCTLWGGFWFQFVIGFLYELPALYTLSDGNWYLPNLDFYRKTPGSFPFSVAGNFVFYSCIGSALGLFFGWIFTRGVAGKWRLRFAVVIFVIILMGWSGAAYLGKRAAWNEGLDASITKARHDWRQASDWNEDEWTLRYYRLRVEELEALARMNPYLKD